MVLAPHYAKKPLVASFRTLLQSNKKTHFFRLHVHKLPHLTLLVLRAQMRGEGGSEEAYLTHGKFLTSDSTALLYILYCTLVVCPVRLFALLIISFEAEKAPLLRKFRFLNFLFGLCYRLSSILMLKCSCTVCTSFRNFC